MKPANDDLILVAGGAGFIGSHPCKALLEAGHVSRFRKLHRAPRLL